MQPDIRPAQASDTAIIAHIGRLGVEESHRDSCSAEDMNNFLSDHYNEEAICGDISQTANIYHLIYHDGKAAGFSKIILGATHPNIPGTKVTKLDRIYLLRNFYDRKLGLALLNFNIDYSRQRQQSGMWLFTWTGNERAVRFYQKAGFNIVGSHRFKVSETHYNPHHQMMLAY
jgi:ribosomal protein S18 acetylase RimI-like enzyme